MIFTKWLHRVSKQKSQQEPTIFVVDTNMLLNRKSDFIAKFSEGRQDIVIFIPWAVIDELSGFRRRSFSGRSGFSQVFRADVRNAWKIVSEKIDAQKWRTIGSGGKTFKEIFQRNGFALGVNDVRILSAVGNLREKFPRVFLVSRDRMLCDVAKELGIQTIDSLADLSETAGAEK